MYRHFATVADAVDKPVILYNVPGRTASDMSAETVARLAEHQNILGIKEATGDIDRLKDIRDRVDDQFMLYSGDDFTVLPFIAAGGHGVITVSGNVAPAAMSRLCALATAGKLDEARELDNSLQPLNSALFIESNPIPVKWALAQMGLIQPNMRLPLTEHEPQYHEGMRAAMANAGITLENAA
jgi:4-hydroxy-tetrahydrodipicolinate synthase